MAGFLDRRDVRAVVDLGAAPGGWSQVVAEKFGWRREGDEEGVGVFRARGTVVAVDLLPVEPISGVRVVCGDFLLGSTTERIRRLLLRDDDDNPDGKADVILSDMAANVSGNGVCDIESSLEICEAVVEFAKVNLRSADEIGRRMGGVLLYVSALFSLDYLRGV